ncbi:TRAP transporter small permease [Virgibacillus sp. W0181]|uniref:TRAP transporter small permease n=1 Tax=Virgibacillus sp. W0181 TaxID=3391581 RepID=UPI003F448DBE
MLIQVIMRYVFDNSLTWSEELSRYAFVWFVYTSASYAVRYQRHVKFNFLVNIANKITPLAALLIQFIALLFWIGFLIFLDIYSIKLVMDQYNTQQLSPANQIPMYLIYIGLPLGSFMMTFRVSQHIYRLIIDVKKHVLKTRMN